MAVAMIGPKFYAWDRNGKPLAFGKLYTYQARTNVPKPTYQSEDKVVENTNPVILNGEGYANVYLDGSYKMVLKDDKDNEIWSSDPVTSSQAEEWVNCVAASYVSSTSFKVYGNQTDKYTKDRKVRVDNNATEYSYSKILSSTYASGETLVVIADPVVLTGTQGACVSVVGPESSFNGNDLGLLTNYQSASVDDMIDGIPKTLSVGETCGTPGATWIRTGETGDFDLDFKRFPGGSFYERGTFLDGCIVTKSDQALLHSDGFYYAYHGDLSSHVVVAPGDSPETLPNGNWSCVGLLNGYPINNAFNYGVVESDTYDPQQAWENRTAIQLMCQNMFFSEFDIDGRGQILWMLSTVHPLRSNITIRINSGCKMRGRYDDPSIPQSLISQSGGMIGMVLYADPDNDNFTVTGIIVDSHVIIDGDVSTEFSAVHNKAHGNLCVGFFTARNCHITGEGGVSESDHKGLNFDGDCQDCTIDVAYVRGTSNQPLVMKGNPLKSFSSNVVKCKSISEIKFDGGEPKDVVFSRNNAQIDIEIGTYQWNGVDKGQLVSSGRDGVCNVKYGKILGLNQIVRHSDTEFVNISANGDTGGNFQLCDNIATRVDATASVLKDVSIKGLRAIDGLVSVFQSENRVSNFRTLKISNNDFSNAGSAMKTFDLEFGDNNAATVNQFDNINPDGFTPQYPNKINKESESLITGTPTSFTWDYKSPDWNYSFVSMLIDNGGSGVVQGVMSIEARRLTSIDTTLNIAGIPVTVERNGSVFTFTASSGTFLLVRAHN